MIYWTIHWTTYNRYSTYTGDGKIGASICMAS